MSDTTETDRTAKLVEKPDAQGDREGQEYVFGPLNRHWYRRCLDTLEQNLRRSGANPSVEELRELCDKVITGFLTSITAQAPDSDQLQFPADRAYYIPFEGDNAGKFNFTKPFYQFLNGPQTEHNPLFKDSLWSFFPWNPLSEYGKVVIDKQQSVDKDEWTIRFDDMIAVGQIAKKQEADQAAKDYTVLRKSVLVRGEGKDLLDEVFHSQPGTESQRGAAHDPLNKLKAALYDAVVAVFEIHKATPGNFAAEFLLLNHVQVIRWLQFMIEHRNDGSGKRTLPQQDQDYKKLKDILLEAYFLSGDAAANPKRADTLKHLQQFATAEEKTAGADLSLPDHDAENLLLAKELMKYDSHFMKFLDEGDDEAGDGPEGEDSTPDDFKVGRVQVQLKTLRPHLLNFCTHFLNADNEKRLEDALSKSLKYKLLKTGDIGQSFVWVCPDFQELNDSMPEPDGADANKDVYYVKKYKDDQSVDVQAQSAPLARPLVEFYRRHDLACLQVKDGANPNRLERLSDYWRAKGSASRIERLFASFDDDDINVNAGLRVPSIPGNDAEKNKSMEEPRPQNIFLRVRICDLSNEPVINGLFVFTTDHDERLLKGKSHKTRGEDVQDLLAFSKVYFFIVRDYLQGLDRSRDARDIGRLNQNLYEEMISKLMRSMEELEKSLGKDKKALTAQSITDPINWDRFLYEVLNNFAGSLIEKPPEVRIETLQYDRLLMLPLATTAAGKEYGLPFYLFQAIFCERRNGVIVGNHYSLIKPTQSPIEKLTVDQKERFDARSFEQPTIGKNTRRELDAYLEKHYLGQQEKPQRSLVPKLFFASADKQDHGAEWARWVLECFWCSTTNDLLTSQPTDTATTAVGARRQPAPQQATVPQQVSESSLTELNKKNLWIPFLRRLTLDYRELSKEVSKRIIKNDSGRVDNQWFLFRLGLLRGVFNHVKKANPKHKKLEAIRKIYAEILKLEFDNDPDLHVVKLAEAAEPDMFKAVGEWFGLKSDDPKGIAFVSFQLRDEDPFVLKFLEDITNHLANDVTTPTPSPSVQEGTEVGQTDGKTPAEPVTWYHPLLTRPIGDENSPATHKDAGKAIGLRRPPYPDIRSRKQCIGMFLGIVHLEVGQSERDKRRLSYLIALLRDYDRTQAVHTQSKKDMDDQGKKDMEDEISVDLQDLTLFSRTFFQNVQAFVRDSNQGQQLRVLSTDVSQIARNWYSSGIDTIIKELEKELQPLLRQWQTRDLGRLQPEIVDRLVDATLQVLVQREKRVDRTTEIFLESFPFDRLVHVPLFLGDSAGARLSYARTKITGADWNAETSARAYELIRKNGRTWDSRGGRKEIVFGQAAHLGRKSGADKIPAGADLQPDDSGQSTDSLFRGRDGSLTPLSLALNELAENAGLDEFVRSLYEANTIQTLALAGLIVHLLARREQAARNRQTDRELWNPHLDKLAARMRDVLKDSIEIVERLDGPEPVKTRVYMNNTNAPVVFDLIPIAEKGEAKTTRAPLNVKAAIDSIAKKTTDGSSAPTDRGGAAVARDATRMWLFRELFQAIEGKENSVYGLDGQAKSKVFLVFYSVMAPQEFTEAFEDSSAQYRGVFCFVLDDASTDVKDETSAIADREDIRTFVHNCARSLKVILDQQALRNQMLQPGVEQFVTGIMHRLKNELGTPAAALDYVRNVLKSSDKRFKDLADAGQATIEKTRELFNGLKRLSDMQQGEVLLETYSSNWLGWAAVNCLCAAVAGVLKNESPNQAENDGETEEAQVRAKGVKKSESAISAGNDGETEEAKVRAIGDLAVKEMKICLGSPSLFRRDTERIQTELIRLQDLLGTLASKRLDSKAPLKFYLSYEVFSAEPLRFRASEAFSEALNILVENAFQALWSYVSDQCQLLSKESTTINGNTEPIVGRLELMCRRSPTPGEILLEFRNTSERPDPSILKFLTSPTPQLISSNDYKKSNKKGGSGFGHFFARRVILDLCGGRKARRRLDIQFTHLQRDMMACSSVNLLEAPPPSSRTLSVPALLGQVSEAFRERGMVFGREPKIPLPTDQAAACWFPAEVEPLDLFGDICRLLEAARSSKEGEILHWVKAKLCEPLREGAKLLQTLLAETVTSLALAESGPTQSAREPQSVSKELAHRDESQPGAIWRKLRRQFDSSLARRFGSWRELASLLDRWRDDDAASLGRVLQLCQASLEKLRTAVQPGTKASQLDEASRPWRSCLPSDWAADSENGWTVKDVKLVRPMVHLVEKSLAMLEQFRNGANLNMLAIISDEMQKRAEAKFKEFEPILTPDVRRDGFASLMRDMELVTDGVLMPSEEVIAESCLKRHWVWDWQLDHPDPAKATQLQLAFRLYDGKPNTNDPIEPKTEPAAGHDDRASLQKYKKADVATFHRHRTALARKTAAHARKKIGELWLERQDKTPYRTLYLVLNLLGDADQQHTDSEEIS